ncbi:MAG TPA: PrsW family glutamic-type intramembrane protease [Candidatus Gracilibacteria bacterium]
MLFNFSQELLTCALIAFVPIVCWIYFFQTQHHEKRAYVVLTFLAGMLSVMPIKLYEKYWDTAVWYLEHINLFERLSDITRIPSLDTFLAYMVTSVVVSLALFIFVFLMMFCLEVFSGDDTMVTFKDKAEKALESPFLFVGTGLFFGIAAFYLNTRLEHAIWFFVMVGVLEEFIKHLVTRFSDEEHILSIADAIQFSIIVALGFAFVENIIYFLGVFQDTNMALGKNMIIFVVLRSVISVTAHVCFSAIMGYFYGIAYFACEVYQEESKRLQHPFTALLHRVLHLKETTVFREEKMLEGMLLAATIHAAFNSLLEFNQMNVIVVLLCGLFFIVLNLLHRMDVYQKTGTVV